MQKFLDIDYLTSGNDVQRRACQVLREYGIMDKLSAFTPVLAGTIPIGIDISSSDLDILCRFTLQDEFASFLEATFGSFDGFRINTNETGYTKTVVASFIAGDFEIEVFGQDIPVTEQNGWLHMMIEHAILEREGERFRKGVVLLKQDGMKTEPAFAKLLSLKDDDPYTALIKYGRVMGFI